MGALFIWRGAMALIELTGKHAVGENQFAIVDDDMHALLSQWKWKAKPNGGGNNVYAVRNARCGKKNVTLRMHRIVLGIDPSNALDVDHINHNALDNRRQNLRQATRSENALNARRIIVNRTCQHCEAPIKREVSAVATGCAMSCDACIKQHKSIGSRSFIYFTKCAECDKPIAGRTTLKQFCSEACRCRARYARLGSFCVK